MRSFDELFAEFPVLQVNDKVILREFSRDDVKEYFEFYSRPEVNEFIPDTMIPHDEEEAALEIETIIQSFKCRQTVYWAIAEKETGKLIGGCGFHDWNRYNFRIEIAYDLHPNYWRRGIMMACLKKIIEFAFMQMGVVRIQATTVEHNPASNAMLLKFGFQYEGLLRKYKFFKNRMIDVMMFSYTIQDFQKDIKLGKFK